jgi:Uma2 family endonuclease
MALAAQFVEKDRYTEDEYFAYAMSAFGRWEYVQGEIRAMAGGTDDHNAIITNIGATLHAALAPKGCRVYQSDMRVHTGDDVNTFPDVAVVCGPRVYHRGRTDTITNPVLIVEVLSPSTQGYDRGEKWGHYQTIPTLSDYLLVSPDEPRVLLLTRQADHWDLREAAGLDGNVSLASVGLTLTLADIYAQVEFGSDGSIDQHT